jgi:signal transduction histidine kinase
MHQLTLVTDNPRLDIRNVLASPNLSQTGRTQHSRRTLSATSRGSAATLIASLLSHDIRHHLAAVYCNAEFLSESATTEADRRQLLEEVKLAITDATRVLDFIVFHAKSDLPAQNAIGSFNDLVERTVSAIRPHPHAEGVSIIIAESASVRGPFNQTIVSSAIYNLLLNACFAAQRASGPGRVEVSLHEEPPFICVLVKDNGPGVPDWMLQDLSQPCETWGKRDGTGLGITIVDYVAREYGGTLRIESSSPGCTIFALRLAKRISQF